MIHLACSEYKKMPWKNGQGVTNEIDRLPTGSDSYLWRLSQAHISHDGPFSKFEGYDRWLCVWKGGGIFLNDFKLEPLSPYRFSGDEPVDCKIGDSPVDDIGLIFDRNKILADMRLIEGQCQILSPGTHYFFDLSSGDTIKIDRATELSVPKSLWISVSRT